MELARILTGGADNEGVLEVADHALRNTVGLLQDAGLQQREPLLLDRFRCGIRQFCRRGAGSLAVDETVGVVKADLGNQVHRRLEVLFSLAGEADDEVAGDIHAGTDLAQLADDRFVFEHGVVALHHRQHAVGTSLHRQVHLADKLGHCGIAVDQALRKFERVRCGEADAFDAVDGRDQRDQCREVCNLAVVRRAAITIYVLAQQGDFADTILSQMHGFGEHIVQRPAHFFAACVGHHAE